MSVPQLPYDELLRVAAAARLDVGLVRRTLEGEACGRLVTAETAARIRRLAAEALARLPASRRVRVAPPEARP